MELLAHARIVMWEGASLWVVDATPVTGPEPRRTDFHAHHAIQVTISLGGHFKLATEDVSVPGEVVAVAADARHVFEAEGLIAFIFIEPECRLGRAVSNRLFSKAKLAAVSPELLGDFRERAAATFRSAQRNDSNLIDLGRAAAAALAADAKADAPDLRIRKLIAWAAQQLDGPVSLSDAVVSSGLSASRLRHLFVEQTGLPFKTYLLWLRLTRALEAFAGGSSLTQAAHDSGFADSAHLSRTFRRMFGVAPTGLRMT
ncbi:MAG: AraC family transcriptional regulator [Alphaproteobacteria bacterium]